MATAATGKFRNRARSLVSLQPGEARPTLLLALHLFLAIASVVALKAARNSLFLTRFSARDLPFAYLVIALAAGLAVSFYVKLSARLSQRRLLIYTQLFLALQLALFWWAFRGNFGWTPAAFYVWTGVYAVLIPAQVWILAGRLFTIRQAYRVFPIVAAGGILGAAVGGLGTQYLARMVQTPTLLLVSTPLLLSSVWIVHRLWRAARAQPPSSSTTGKVPPDTSLAGSVRAIWNSRYLSLLAVVVIASTILNSLVDYQFMAIAGQTFANQEDRTAFFAAFSGSLALLSFLVHLVLIGGVTQWMRMHLAIFVLPVSLLAGSAVALLWGGLLAALLLKGFDGTFRHSVDRFATELLYVPLPTRLKQQVKSFIDVAVTRWADGLAALLLYLLVGAWGLSPQRIGWVNVTLAIVWLVAARKLRAEYVTELRKSIETREASAESVLAQIAGVPSSEDDSSRPGNDERQFEAPGWPQVPPHLARAELAALLLDPVPDIRRRALDAVVVGNVPGCAQQVAVFLYLEHDVHSLWQALDYLERHDPGESQVLHDALLKAPYKLLRATVAAWHLARGDSAHRVRASAVFDQFLQSVRGGDPLIRQTAAELLARVPPDLPCQDALTLLLQDLEPKVVTAAILAAGETRRQDLLPLLVELTADLRFRAAARQALVRFGPGVLTDLAAFLADARLPEAARETLPRVLSSIGGQSAADTLVATLPQSPELDWRIARALNRIRYKDATIGFEAARIISLVSDQSSRYCRWVAIIHYAPHSGLDQGARAAAAGQLRRTLEVIFRLLALLYPPEDILRAHRVISGGNPEARANAVELLDHLLPDPLRHWVLSVVEDSEPERILDRARMRLGLQLPGPQEALKELAAFQYAGRYSGPPSGRTATAGASGSPADPEAG